VHRLCCLAIEQRLSPSSLCSALTSRTCCTELLEYIYCAVSVSPPCRNLQQAALPTEQAPPKCGSGFSWGGTSTAMQKPRLDHCLLAVPIRHLSARCLHGIQSPLLSLGSAAERTRLGPPRLGAESNKRAVGHCDRHAGSLSRLAGQSPLSTGTKRSIVQAAQLQRARTLHQCTQRSSSITRRTRAPKARCQSLGSPATCAVLRSLFRWERRNYTSSLAKTILSIHQSRTSG
jgi:hypothetical protein